MLFLEHQLRRDSMPGSDVADIEMADEQKFHAISVQTGKASLNIFCAFVMNRYSLKAIAVFRKTG